MARRKLQQTVFVKGGFHWSQLLILIPGWALAAVVFVIGSNSPNPGPIFASAFLIAGGAILAQGLIKRLFLGKYTVTFTDPSIVVAKGGQRFLEFEFKDGVHIRYGFTPKRMASVLLQKQMMVDTHLQLKTEDQAIKLVAPGVEVEDLLDTVIENETRHSEIETEVLPYTFKHGAVT